MNTIVAPLPGASRGWQIGCGVLLIIAGMLCVMMPGIAALATALVLGWALVFSGCLKSFMPFARVIAAGIRATAPTAYTSLSLMRPVVDLEMRP